MDYDELLEKINEECVTTYEDATGNVPMSPSALRAVVELHKPRKDTRENWYESEECRAVTDCSERYGVEFVEVPYPCPTIQAIEKVLNGRR